MALFLGSWFVLGCFVSSDCFIAIIEHLSRVEDSVSGRYDPQIEIRGRTGFSACIFHSTSTDIRIQESSTNQRT